MEKIAEENAIGRN